VTRGLVAGCGLHSARRGRRAPSRSRRIPNGCGRRFPQIHKATSCRQRRINRSPTSPKSILPRARSTGAAQHPRQHIKIRACIQVARKPADHHIRSTCTKIQGQNSLPCKHGCSPAPQPTIRGQAGDPCRPSSSPLKRAPARQLADTSSPPSMANPAPNKAASRGVNDHWFAGATAPKGRQPVQGAAVQTA